MYIQTDLRSAVPQSSRVNNDQQLLIQLVQTNDD